MNRKDLETMDCILELMDGFERIMKVKKSKLSEDDKWMFIYMHDDLLDYCRDEKIRVDTLEKVEDIFRKEELLHDFVPQYKRKLSVVISEYGETLDEALQKKKEEEAEAKSDQPESQ